MTDLIHNLKTHVTILSDVIGERNWRRYAELDKAASYIETAFLSSGCEPRLQEYTARGKRFRNIEVEFQGTDPKAGILIIGAHYDTERNSPGANDNASGIAALIEIGRQLQRVRGRQTVRLVAFVNEERPFLRTRRMGSYVYARACRKRGDPITSMISLKTIGCKSDRQGFSFGGMILPRRGDFIAVISNRRSRRLALACRSLLQRYGSVRVVARSLPGIAPGVKSSDHWSFWKNGFPAVMITDTAPLRYSHYHRGTDTPDKICFPFLRDVVEGLQGLALQATTERVLPLEIADRLPTLPSLATPAPVERHKSSNTPLYASFVLAGLVAGLFLLRPSE